MDRARWAAPFFRFESAPLFSEAVAWDDRLSLVLFRVAAMPTWPVPGCFGPLLLTG